MQGVMGFFVLFLVVMRAAFAAREVFPRSGLMLNWHEHETPRRRYKYEGELRGGEPHQEN